MEITFYLPSLLLSLQIKAEAAAYGDVGDTGEAGDDDGEEVQPPTAWIPDVPVILDVRPKKSIAEEDRMLFGITERGQQSFELQQKMLEMLNPPVRVTERTTYADWTKSVMEDLDPSLWRRFQVEHSKLLYRYLGMNDDIKQSAAAAQQAGMVQQQFQAPSEQFQDPS